ncbi:MAG: hypothetical protein E7158_03215 [Firmicutes bacterium]|nr:hypothetical protein [Bacillota bacterium]
MQGALENVKRILSNKNTLTIVATIAGVLVLYIGYNMRVKQAIEPVTIPYAREELSSREQIKEELIGYMEVSSSVLKISNKGIISNSSDVIDQFVSYGVTIPENSFFYYSTVMSKNRMPSTTFTDEEVKDGYTVYSLNVDLHKTYGNSICTGNYIDLYLKAVDETGKVIFGRFIESIKVLDVRDDQGNRVFESTAETRTPSQLLFAVPDELYLLLMKSEYVGGIEVIPVPRNASYSDKKDDESTKVSSQYIKDYVLSKTATIPDEVIKGNKSTNDVINSNND